MIILDTNVLSEIIWPTPDARVIAWFTEQDPSQLYTTALSCAEMLFGVGLMPAGKRRDDIAMRIGQMFNDQFKHRQLPFDATTAPAFAQIATKQHRSGRPIATIDAMIAAITTTHNAHLATRDGDFDGCGISLINPWR